MAILKAFYLSLVFIFLSHILISSAVATIEKERYQKILGVRRKASSIDIRSAYKRLAKAWHPDKTDHPNALSKFIEIQKAYERLMHEDVADDGTHGTHGSDAADAGEREYSYIGFREKKEHFEHLQKYLSFYKSIEISDKHLKGQLLMESKTTPIVIVVYNDNCYRCAVLVHMYGLLAEIFENAGIRFVAINSYTYPILTKNFGLRPDYAGLTLLLGMHFTSYQAKQPKVENILNFITSKLRSRVFIANTKDHVQITRFLNNWYDKNRVKVLIAATESYRDIKLNYLVAAYTWRANIDFGYLRVDDACSSHACALLKLTPQTQQQKKQQQQKQNTLLIFNEDAENPVARFTTNDVSKKLLWPLLAVHQFPHLPRLRTQQMLEDLCPTVATVVSSRPEPELCALLTTWDDQKETHKLARKVLRGLAKRLDESMLYVYLNARVQRPFIEAIMQQQNIDENFLGLFVIWRKNTSVLAIEHIQNINWTDERAIQRSIKRAAKRLIESCWVACSERLRTVPQLYNEYHYDHGRLWAFLQYVYNALPDFIKDLTPLMVIVVMALVLRVVYAFLTAIQMITLISLRNEFILSRIMLEFRLLSRQLEDNGETPEQLEYALMLFVAQRHPISAVRNRNRNFIYKIILRFGTLLWGRYTRRPKRLCRAKKSRALKLKKKSHKRIGYITPQGTRASLSIYVKKIIKRNRITRKIRSSNRSAQWFLVLVPRSLLEEQLPSQRALN